MLARGGTQAHRPWTDDEKATIRRMYPTDIGACVAALPGRTREAVSRQARLLGVRKRPPRWSAAENDRLRRLWGFGVGIPVIAKRLGRTEWAVFEHAQLLGLQLGVPRGYEYFTGACERTGFHGKTLWMILRWAEVVTRPTPTKPGQRRRRYYVDPFDVDDAIRRWLATETVDAAARRVGVAGRTLHHWLRRAGVIQPRGRMSSRHHRIPSEVIDRVVAERRARSRT